ncbi:MAG: cytochrome c biogenesis protein ResB [Alistipes sp.]|nr:cytochrome c biogenesis protein ResB [Alistipes sp.]
MKKEATGRPKTDAYSSSGAMSLSVIVVCAFAAAGFALQLAAGGFNLHTLAYPVDALMGGAMVLLCVAMAIVRDSAFVRWFTGVPMSVSLIAGLGLLALIMGLTPQGATPMGGTAEVSARLGFSEMTSSWPFVMIYTLLLLSLGGLIARRLAEFRARDWAFHMNHLGLWLILFAAGLGSADTERYIVQVDEGAVTKRGYDDRGMPREMPIAVRLHDFTMEEYPPQSPAARPEPKRFASDIEITTPDGSTKRGLTEVNHPLNTGGWMVYQYGYDREAGPTSTYSVVEIVRDPWLAPVYAGFIMMTIGAVAMIWRGKSKEEGKKDGLE